MAIHCMLLTGDNIRIVQNFLSEFKDKYDCMQTFDMVRLMISAWQSVNFKEGEEPTMPTKDEIEKFIQSQLSKDKQSSVAPVRSTNIADYVNTEGKDKGFLTKKGEELLSTTFDKSKFNKGTNKVSIYPGVNGTEIRIDWTSPRTGNSASVIYYGSSTRKVWDLFNSKGGNVTDVTSDIYWDALNKIIPNSLRELVESGKYNELDTTAIETDTKTLIVKKTALEDYFEKEYNVFKQGRSLDYNTKQINKALSPVQENGKITPVITTEATPYTKGLPQKNPNTAYLFTENAQAYVTSLQLDDSWIERGYNKGNSVKTGVSDVRGTNQAGIRASSYNTYGATNISRNAFGIIVKKYQQKLSQSSFLSKEGQFEDTDSDFELFKQLNLHMFNNLNSFNAENIVLPNQIALGKSALPLRFVEWLKE